MKTVFFAYVSTQNKSITRSASNHNKMSPQDILSTVSGDSCNPQEQGSSKLHQDSVHFLAISVTKKNQHSANMPRKTMNYEGIKKDV